MKTKPFDKPNIKLDIDKLSKTISYTFFFLFIFMRIVISAKFNNAVKTPTDKSMDLLNLRSSIPSQLVLSGSIDDAAIFNILAIIKEKIYSYKVFSIFFTKICTQLSTDC